MPSAPHTEHHFTAGATVRDVVIGMSDGLTVPFALAAGLSGAKVGTSVVVLGGSRRNLPPEPSPWASAALLAARTDQEHYQSELEREIRESREIPVEEAAEVSRVLEGWGVHPNHIEPIVAAITFGREALGRFHAMRFESAPSKNRTPNAPSAAPPPSAFPTSRAA